MHTFPQHLFILYRNQRLTGKQFRKSGTLDCDRQLVYLVHEADRSIKNNWKVLSFYCQWHLSTRQAVMAKVLRHDNKKYQNFKGLFVYRWLSVVTLQGTKTPIQTRFAAVESTCFWWGSKWKKLTLFPLGEMNKLTSLHTAISSFCCPIAPLLPFTDSTKSHRNVSASLCDFQAIFIRCLSFYFTFCPNYFPN